MNKKEILKKHLSTSVFKTNPISEALICAAMEEYAQMMAKDLAKIAKQVVFIYGNETQYRKGSIGYDLRKDAEAALEKLNKQSKSETE